MVKVGVVGATGYTGEELVRLLVGHPQVSVTALSAKIDRPTKFFDIFRNFLGKIDLVCKELNTKEFIELCDLIFLALPHRVSMEIAPVFLKAGKKVIDLSADYRLPATTYAKWYGARHRDVKNLIKAVYGLPEVYKGKIKKATLVANPGCYPTSAILACAPLLKSGAAKPDGIIIDSKSGVTGAGRKADISLSFGEIEGSLKAYKVNQHQHLPEINQQISRLAAHKISAIFVPHLVPLRRGILSTVYLKLKKRLTYKKVAALYNEFYKGQPFVRILSEGEFPQIKDVLETNFCNLGIKVEPEKNLAICISAIDNLTKGAAGQAVQNMNIMCGFEETTGLL